METGTVVVSTPMAEAFESAKPLKKKGKEKSRLDQTSTQTQSGLPDVASIEVPKMSVERKAEVTKTGQERREWAQNAGAKLAEILSGISVREALLADPNLICSDEIRKELELLRKQRDQLLMNINNDPALKKHVELAQLLEELRAVNDSSPDEIEAMMQKLVKVSEYRVASDVEIAECQRNKKWPTGAIFMDSGVKRRIYFSTHSSEALTPGQRAVQAETRKKVDAAKASHAASIRRRGNSDLAGLIDGKIGEYYLFSPKRKDERTGKRWYEGHMLVRVRDLNEGKPNKKPYIVVEVADAAGSLASFRHAESKRFIPHLWLRTGRIETEKQLEQEYFDDLLRILKTLRRLCDIWVEREEQKKKIEQSESNQIATVPA